MQIKTAISQIKPATGDLQGNVDQILADIDKAKKENVDILVFPELAITGYCCGALFTQKHFIENNLAFLQKKIVPEITGELICVIGYVDIFELDPENPLSKGVENQDFGIHNSCAVIQNGEIIKKYNKMFLANDGHHEDRKYFTPGIFDHEENPIATNLQIKGETVRLSTLICEDVWQDPEVYRSELDSAWFGVDKQIVIALNHSYFYYGKTKQRMDIVSNLAQTYGCPVVYCNPVGLGDIVKNIMIYDGNSFAVNEIGCLIHQSPAFKESFDIVDIPFKGKKEIIAPNYPEKYEEIYDALVFAHKEFFRLCGIKRAQVHISGGLDSAVVAALSVEAMGPDNCVFISNPTTYNSEETKGAAQRIADYLKARLWWNPTGEIVDLINRTHENSFKDPLSSAGISSVHAVSRTVQGLACTHFFSSGIVATGNHTEIVLGWASFHDIGSIGVMSLIGDLTKVEVFGLAEYINKRFEVEVVPSELYDGRLKPAAELPDAKEDPFDYFVVSGICAEIIRNKKGLEEIMDAFENKTLTDDYFPLDWEGKTIYDKLDSETFRKRLEGCFKLARFSVYKAAQSAPVPLISRYSRGFSSRETLINKYEGQYDI